MATDTVVETDNEKLALFSTEISDLIDTETVQLPMLSGVATELMTLSNDADVDIKKFSDLIHGDQTLASHILRVTNSAAYAGSSTIVSLQQAITRLGMKLVTEIVLAISIQKDVFNVAGFEEEIKKILNHALVSGLYGKEIARMKRHNVECQFMCGLLHTVGRSAVLGLVAEAKKNLSIPISAESANELVEKFETMVGAKVATQWKLPQQVSNSIKHYKNYVQATEFQKEISMTYLSGLLATWLLDSESISENSIKENPVFILLNYYPEEIQNLIDKRDKVHELFSAMTI